ETNLDTNGPDFVTISAATNNILNPDLRDPYTRQFNVSLERELMPNLGAKVNYIYMTQFDNVQTVNVLRPYSYFNVPLSRQDPGPDGVVGTADDGGMVNVWDYPAQYRGSTFVGNQRLNVPDDHRPIRQTIEGAVSRRSVGKWSLLGSVGATKNRVYL